MDIKELYQKLRLKCPICYAPIALHNFVPQQQVEDKLVLYVFCAKNHQPIKSIVVVISNQKIKLLLPQNPLTKSEIVEFSQNIKLINQINL